MMSHTQLSDSAREQRGAESAPGAEMLPRLGEPMDRALHARIRKYLKSEEQNFALDLELRAIPGFTILFGPSGAGKTTLLDCLAGLLMPESGSIEVGDLVLFDSRTRVNLPIAKRRVGYVFQDLALFPHLTVEQNVGYGLPALARGERKERVAAILSAFRIDLLANRRPKEISGGERQRVALARTLVTDPVLLLLDEPLAALDAATKMKIVDDLRGWNETHHIPILYVTHSRDEVFGLGEHAVALDSGRILAQGTPHQILSAPRQETVAQLAGFENILDASVDSVHEDRGTMTCVVSGKAKNPVQLETPLVRADVGAQLRVGIRAGDILLAIAAPVGLSARNILPGRIVALERRDVIVCARVDCGVVLEVHLTLAARDALQLGSGRDVWLVIKTHSCHLMQA